MGSRLTNFKTKGRAASWSALLVVALIRSTLAVDPPPVEASILPTGDKFVAIGEAHRQQAAAHTQKAKELEGKDELAQRAHLNAAASHLALEDQFKQAGDGTRLTETERKSLEDFSGKAAHASSAAETATQSKNAAARLNALNQTATDAYDLGTGPAHGLDTTQVSAKGTTLSRTESEALEEHRRFRADADNKRQEALTKAHEAEQKAKQADRQASYLTEGEAKKAELAKAERLKAEQARHEQNADAYLQARNAHNGAVRNLERSLETPSKKGQTPTGSDASIAELQQSRSSAFQASRAAERLANSDDESYRATARKELERHSQTSQLGSSQVAGALKDQGFTGKSARTPVTFSQMDNRAQNTPGRTSLADLDADDGARRLGTGRFSSTASAATAASGGAGSGGAGSHGGGAGAGGSHSGSGSSMTGSLTSSSSHVSSGVHVGALDDDEPRFSIPGRSVTAPNRRVTHVPDDCSTAATIDNKMGCSGINRLTQGAQMMSMMTMMGVGTATSAMGMAGQQYAMDQASQKAALEAAANTQINTGIAETSAGGLTTMMGVFQLAAAAKKLSDAKKIEQAGQASNYEVKLNGTENHEGQGIHQQGETGYVTGKGLAKQVVENFKLNENSDVHFTQVSAARGMTAAEQKIHDDKKAFRQEEAKRNEEEVASRARELTTLGAGELRQAASGAMMGGLQSVMMGGQQVASGATQIAAGKDLQGRIARMTAGQNPSIVNQDMPGFAGFGTGQTFAAPGAISGAGTTASGASDSPADMPSSTPPDLGMGFDPNPLGTGVPEGQAPGKFVAGDGSNGQGGNAGSYSPSGETNAAPATDAGSQQPALSGDAGISVPEGGGHGAYAGGGGAGKGSDGGPDLSSLLAKFLPQKEEAEKKGNSIMDFSGKGGVQGVYTPLGRQVNIFQRVSETYQDKQMRGTIGG